MSGSSAVASSTPPPLAAAAPLCLLTQFTVATYPLPLPSSPTGCLWLCIFDLLSSFSYFLLFWHSQRLRWTHKGGQQQEEEGQVAWAGMRGMHGAGGGRGVGQLVSCTYQLCAPALCTWPRDDVGPSQSAWILFLLRFHISV